MSVSPEVRDVLLGAADSLERDGWMQNGYGRAGGPRCVSGALKTAAGYEGAVATLDAYRTMVEALGLGFPHLCEWNDAPERTQAEVVAKLREVAAS